MLAALVVLLLSDFFNDKSDLRVVYIPDSSRLILRSVEQLQRSLLLAFADDAEACQTITEAETAKQLEDFVRSCSYGSLLFVVDQFNSLTVHQLQGTQDPQAQQKSDAISLIARCSDKQCIIRAISINDENKGSVEKKQTGQKMFRLDGELSDVSPAICTRCAFVVLVLVNTLILVFLRAAYH